MKDPELSAVGSKIIDALPDECSTGFVLAAMGNVLSVIFMDQFPDVEERIREVERFNEVMLKAAHVPHPGKKTRP